MQVNEFTLKITNFDNQAMEEDRSGEVARMLRDIAKRIEDYGIPNQDGVRLMDSNGNPVGAVAVDWSDDETVELAVRGESGEWELIGDFTSIENAKAEAQEYGGSAEFGISTDPAGGHYEITFTL